MVIIDTNSGIVHLLKCQILSLGLDRRVTIRKCLVSLIASIVLYGILRKLRAYTHVHLLLLFEITWSFAQQGLSLLPQNFLYVECDIIVFKCRVLEV